MSFMKNEKKQDFQYIIDECVKRKNEIINRVKEALGSQTVDEQEREHRLKTFNALLLKATYATEEELENGFETSLPPSHNNPTISFIIEQLKEINGFCNQSFSDDHEDYQQTYNTLTFPTPETKRGIREQFGKLMIEMVFEQTGTTPSIACTQCL